METIIDDRYKIDFFLDTNILVDYVQGENQNLIKSLDYLAQSKYVRFHSSHYVEFEFTEVRKRNEFYRKVHGNYPPKDLRKGNHSFMNCFKKYFCKVGTVQDYGKKNWKDSGIDYLECQEEIGSIIKNDIIKLKEHLQVDFNDHVLHEKLVHTACEIVLATKVSREDSMVLVSCVFPNPHQYLDYCVILTNDNQYSNAYQHSKSIIDAILDKENIPHVFNILNTKNISKANLYSSKNINIPLLWNDFLLDLIKSKHKSCYLGHTIVPNKKSREEGYVWIDIEDKTKQLYDSEGLIFVPNDLSYFGWVTKDFDYWQKRKCQSLPYSNTKDSEYSMKPNMEISQLQKLQEKGALCFYYNKIEEQSSTVEFDL